MNDAAPLLPIGADLVGILRDLEPVADGECRAGLFNHFLGFVGRVYRKRDDLGIFLLEFFKMCLEVGDLPNAVGSPYAAVKNDDGIVALDISGDIELASEGGLNRITRKWIARS